MAREVTLRFHLDEEVMPYDFAQKVAEMLGSTGTLRVGESVVDVEDYIRIYIDNVSFPEPLLPWLSVTGETS